MIDDHDRCDWVSVSSGTGSPGCPGQNLHTHAQPFYGCLDFVLDNPVEPVYP